MKPIYSLSLLIFLSVSAFSQGSGSSWAKSAGDSTVDIGNAITTDSHGHVLVAGYFDSPSITFGNFTLTNSFHNSIFLVKYSSTGEVIWAKNYEIDSSQVSGITTNNNGDIFIIGTFSTQKLILGVDTLKNKGTNNIYFAKLDSNGTILWARTAGGTSYCEGKSITTDSHGDIVIAGNYYGYTITLGNYTLQNFGEWDFFVAKYNTNGGLIWAIHEGDESNDMVNSVSTDLNKNIIIAGSFSSSSISIGATQLNNSSVDEDLLFAKYDSNGNALWAKSAGGYSLDKATGCSSDSFGNVFVIGTYYSASITFGSTTLTKVLYSDIFVVKYDPQGNSLWANNIGGSLHEYAGNIEVAPNGSVIVTGDFNSPTLVVGNKTLTSYGYDDVFIVKYNSMGSYLSAYNIGGTNSELILNSTTDASGNLYITGMYYSSDMVIESDTLINAGNADVFIAKFVDAIVSGTEQIKKNTIKIYPNPTENFFLVEGISSTDKTLVEIYDIHAKLILSKEILNNSSIDISHFSQGIYIIKMDNKIQRIVKM